jgi:surfeit locus 1 family protein
MNDRFERFGTNRFFSIQWLLTTLLAIAAVGVMVRLGFWQLDRLEQRQAYNARVQAQLDQPRLDLDARTLESVSLAAGLPEMEYRAVAVTGEYDFTRQVALRNQAWENRLGVRLLTPLHIRGSDQWVLVDRGWIPYEDFTAGNLALYDEPGEMQVKGMIRRSQSRPDFGRRTDPTPASGSRLDALYLANVALVAQQMPYPLLPVYIQQAPDPAWEGPPYRSLPTLELTEGPHLGYAIQWFAFAAILGIGYPVFVRRETMKREL